MSLEATRNLPASSLSSTLSHVLPNYDILENAALPISIAHENDANFLKE